MPREQYASAEDIATPTYRKERVLIETIHHRITGSLTLPNDAYHNRLSDLLNAPDRWFFAVTDATLTPREGCDSSEHEFVAVSRAQIVCVVNVDESDED